MIASLWPCMAATIVVFTPMRLPPSSLMKPPPRKGSSVFHELFKETALSKSSDLRKPKPRKAQTPGHPLHYILLTFQVHRSPKLRKSIKRASLEKLRPPKGSLLLARHVAPWSSKGRRCFKGEETPLLVLILLSPKGLLHPTKNQDITLNHGGSCLIFSGQPFILALPFTASLTLRMALPSSTEHAPAYGLKASATPVKRIFRRFSSAPWLPTTFAPSFILCFT
eukprot:Gb_18070 [translate_table: standard]